MNKSLVAALFAGLVASSAAMASTTPSPEPIAIKFKGTVETVACRVTVGSGSDNTVSLGNIAVQSNGKIVPVDLHFSNCRGRSISSFMLTGTGQAHADGSQVEIEGGKLPTNLEHVQVGLYANNENQPGDEIAVNQNIITDPIMAGHFAQDFTWRPMYAQLLGENNFDTGEVEAVGFFELKYN